MRDKKFQIVMISSDDAEIKELHASRSNFIIISTLIIAIVLTMLYFTTNYLTDIFYGKRLAALRSQNKQLVTKIVSINDRIEVLTNQLVDIEHRDEAVRIYADLPEIDRDIRLVGVGGAPRGENARLDYLLPPGGLTISEIEFDLGKIERALHLEAKSLEEIYERFKAEKEKALHTPSIRPLLSGYFTDGFGPRKDPFTGKITDHPGLDVSARRGTPVFSTADGVVVEAKRSPTYGNTIKVDHGYGYQTRYAHLSKITVKKHQKVLRGQKLGEVGSTGRSTAPHLHYEVYKNGVRRDPAQYFFLNHEDIARL